MRVRYQTEKSYFKHYFGQYENYNKGGGVMDYQNEYNDWLDEIHPLTGTSCNPFSVLLEAGDPIAYNCGYDDFLEATGKEEQ